jgi:uncharacterized coiled-coil protein SlyX
MDSELEQSFQLCVSLLQSFPQQVSQHHQQSSLSLSQQLAEFQQQAEQINAEMREMEEKLREVRGKQHEERAKGLVLMGELEQLKAAKASEAAVLQERSENLTEKSEELSVRSGQLKQEIEYLASKLSLYCNSTRISWDYESTSTLSGHILVSPHKQPFSFPLSQPRGKPSFDQVNQLWALMD